MTETQKKLRTFLRNAAYDWQNNPLGWQQKDFQAFQEYYWSWFDEGLGVTLNNVLYAWRHPKKVNNPIALLS